MVKFCAAVEDEVVVVCECGRVDEFVANDFPMELFEVFSRCTEVIQCGGDNISVFVAVPEFLFYSGVSRDEEGNCSLDVVVSGVSCALAAMITGDNV